MNSRQYLNVNMWEVALILLLLLVLIVSIIYKRNNHYDEFWKHIHTIPGPKEYPIIGTLFERGFDAETVFIKSRIRCRKFFPIFKMWTLSFASVAIISPEDIELVLSDMKHNKKGKVYEFLQEWLGSGLLTSNGFFWQRRRKMITPAFHFGILKEFVEIFNTEAENLVQILAEKCNGPYINVVNPITEYSLEIIVEIFMGKKLSEFKDNSTYKKAIHTFGDMLIHRLTRPWIYPWILYRLSSTGKKVREVVNVLHDFSRKVIGERKKLYETDGVKSYSMKKHMALVDLLLSAKYEKGSIDDEGIRDEVDTLLFEGHDTTSMAICYTLMTLANEKTIQEKIVNEIYEVLGNSERALTFNDLTKLKFMERCIKECLRLYPTVPVITRIAGEDIKTHSGYIIPKGCDIMIYIYHLHRSPQIWEDPEKFDPDRFLPENVRRRHCFAYLPFSAGPRNCIGQRFAILEIKTVLCGILRKFILEPVDTPQNVKFKADMVLRPVGEIRVKFVLRK